MSDPIRVIETARDNVENPALPAIRASFGLSADEALALVHAIDRWLEAKWDRAFEQQPAWLTRAERREGRNLHG